MASSTSLVLCIPLFSSFYINAIFSETIQESNIPLVQQTTINERPYHVAILINGKYVCGGSILTRKLVLSSLHCTMWGVLTNIRVRAGSSINGNGGQEIPVKGTCTYAVNLEVDGHQDIVVFILAKTLEFGSDVQPISISYDDVPEGATAVITGWDLTNQFPRSVLQKIIATKSNESLCTNSGTRPVTNSICLNVHEIKGLNEVKTGGPVVVNNKQVALDAYGSLPSCQNNRGLFLKLSAHRKYIENCKNLVVDAN